jgi:hypothetical protein
MTGPHHYKRAEEMLAQIEAAHAPPDGTDMALAIRAQAHALLALAAATATDTSSQRFEWQDVAGRTSADAE